jgi:hypothetical protein
MNYSEKWIGVLNLNLNLKKGTIHIMKMPLVFRLEAFFVVE